MASICGGVQLRDLCRWLPTEGTFSPAEGQPSNFLQVLSCLGTYDPARLFRSQPYTYISIFLITPIHFNISLEFDFRVSFTLGDTVEAISDT